jgi:hypothetical protein
MRLGGSRLIYTFHLVREQRFVRVPGLIPQRLVTDSGWDNRLPNRAWPHRPSQSGMGPLQSYQG